MEDLVGGGEGVLAGYVMVEEACANSSVLFSGRRSFGFPFDTFYSRITDIEWIAYP